MLPLVEGGFFVYIGDALYRLGRGKKEKYFNKIKELNDHLFNEASQIIEIKTEGTENILLSGDILVEKLRKLSFYKQIVSYLDRMNIWKICFIFFLKMDVHSADQFTDETFLKGLIAQLSSEKLTIGPILSVMATNLL